MLPPENDLYPGRFPLSHACLTKKREYGHSWGAAAGGGEVTHGLGLIGAAFGLAISVGPILGGSLSEYHRTTGCLLSASMSLVALLSLKFFGWEETAPAVLTTTAVNTSGRRGRWRSWCMKGSKWTIVNPFSVLRVFMESRWEKLRAT